MTEEVKLDVDRRLARIAGQIGGIRKMVQNEKYCIDVLTQINAVRGALDQVAVAVFTSYAENCLMRRGSGDESADCEARSDEQLIEEIRLTLSRFLK